VPLDFVQCHDSSYSVYSASPVHMVCDDQHDVPITPGGARLAEVAPSADVPTAQIPSADVIFPQDVAGGLCDFEFPLGVRTCSVSLNRDTVNFDPACLDGAVVAVGYELDTSVVRCLNIPYWESMLSRVEVPDVAISLLTGLTVGVKVGREPATEIVRSHKWPSAYELRDQVSEVVKLDLQAGRLFGPFESPPTSIM